MRITAKFAGGLADQDNQVLEAGFSEGSDGSLMAVIFQRDLLAEDPWDGDRGTDDYFNNSYCVTLGSGETVYGGLEQVAFSGNRATFDFADPMAGILGIGPQLIVDFEVSDQELQLFQETLKKIVTWGVPSQVPQLSGFS
ncbi:Immunity protein 7 [Aspergillus parasiticus SU-1]|uniref:Immunity protein 7 n=1 Tax=Aspergillus parasiticus (strain ATCC 56775 / NRRL 5862 / SRRC 143 / SU-1) TaxID=1403190 RepID=A0A0F0HZ70_ASPPU|nr:Immunity protein 7 [Aspergillus parasiticus SU-1]